MTLARVAKQLDVAELEEFQRLARVLLAHGVVTRTHPRPGALSAIRRYETVLRNEFARVLRYRLDVGPTSARLTRRAARLSAHRAARTPTGRRFGRWGYTYLCLVLAALEALGEQTTISQLADEVVRVRAGDTDLPVDLTAADQRRGFVDALRWLEVRGVLDVRDGDTERFLTDPGADALYDIDRDIASRLLVASPSVLREVRTTADFLVEPYAATDEGTLQRLRYAVTRHIVTEPAVYYAELADDERAYLRQNRGWLARDIELLTGCPVEARGEGVLLVDVGSGDDALTERDDRFPAPGSVALAAMLLAEAVIAAVRARSSTADGAADLPVGACIGRDELARCWHDDVVAHYRERFTVDYRADPDKLLADALALLERVDLVVRAPGAADGADALIVRPAIARFRPEVMLRDVQPSLLGNLA